jgi:hypothetical protein
MKNALASLKGAIRRGEDGWISNKSTPMSHGDYNGNRYGVMHAHAMGVATREDSNDVTTP